MMEAVNTPIPLRKPQPVERTPGDVAVAMVTAFSARVERAAELVRRGAVEQVEPGRYRVQSAGGGGHFAVREGYCNCPDFAWRGVVPCKHLIAVEMTRALAPTES
jgi:uncharacterized Zn finger protein